MTGVESLEPIVAELSRALGATELTLEANRGVPRLRFARESLEPGLRYLKNQAGFSMLAELGATDFLGYPGRDTEADRFEVHYVLLDLDSGRRLVVKAGVPEQDAVLPSVTELWMGADWMEREVFDMYGIRFTGHPDLRRILMPDEFSAFPLRKDYPLRGRGERHHFPRLTREES
jgi:NADH-quinone oxidoreductase subunit C